MNVGGGRTQLHRCATMASDCYLPAHALCLFAARVCARRRKLRRASWCPQCRHGGSPDDVPPLHAAARGSARVGTPPACRAFGRFALRRAAFGRGALGRRHDRLPLGLFFSAHASAHEHARAAAARYSTLHEQQIALFISAHDFQVERGDTLHTQMAWTMAALHGFCGVRIAGAPRLAVDHRTVACAASDRIPTLHDAGKSLALAQPGDVNAVADGKRADGHHVAAFDVARIAAELVQHCFRSHVEFFETAAHGFVERLDFRIFKAEHNRVVTVLIGYFALDDLARTRSDDRARNAPAIIGEDIRHADLTADNLFHLCYAFSSMSTPAGRSKCMSASMVFELACRMSISRLCVRISKCSRLFLSTCGERNTQERSISVGRGTGPLTNAPVRFAVSTMRSAD